MIDTTKLRQIAQFMCMTAISSANLRSGNQGQFTDAELRNIVAVSFHQGYPDAGAENDEANSEFIAAANPATVLALLARGQEVVIEYATISA